MSSTKLVGVSAKPPRAGMGRPKGIANKTTRLLKDAILQAADLAHPDGMVGYLTKQATDNPGPFMALIGKVLPLQIQGDPDAPLIAIIERRIVKVDN